jgi:putative endopeptidase
LRQVINLLTNFILMKKINLLLTLACFMVLGFWACTPKASTQIQDAGQDAAKDVVTTRKFINPANMDLTASPGKDFYQYANGSWLKNTPIPASESRWGSFSEIAEFNSNALKEILESSGAAKSTMGSNTQKVGDFYTAGMDTVAIEKAGLTPIQPFLKRIDAIKNIKELQTEIARMQTEGINALFNFDIGQDDKISSEIIAKFYQGGIHLPDRDYFFKEDDRAKKIRIAYDSHIANTFKLLGASESSAKKDAEDVMRFEKALAGASLTRVELRDPQKSYNRMKVSEMQKLAPLFNWKEMLATMMVKSDEVNVGQPKFIAQIEKLLHDEKLDQWKTYLKWCVAKTAMSYLNEAMVKEGFNFGKVFSGQKEMTPRWKRVSRLEDQLLGDMVGQLYVEKHFKPEAKKRMLTMLDNLSKTFEKRIKNLDWMSDATKAKALVKLGSFTKKIGYPDKWKDMSSIKISRSSYWDNIVACRSYMYNFEVAKLGKPVDRGEWGMTPPTVNAYYNPSMNEIVFPAGILRFPFFDPDADDAINYGGIGAVIGHEMTHGFDDEGRQYDAEGNLKDWWTDEDAKKFDAKAAMIEQQFSKFTVLDSIHVNGKLTMGENLADFGGISLAYEAFKTFTDQGKSKGKIDGFTAEQRFFLSWGQIWRSNSRDETAAQLIVTDPHSPGKYRCNGAISNMPEFYNAFGIKQGDAMWKPEAERAKVW